MGRARNTFPIVWLTVCSLLAAQGAVAQEAVEAAAPAPALSLELNGAQPSEKGCRLTFVVENRLDAALTKAAFEIALFNTEGVVDRLAVLDFQDLPSGKTKVTRFDLSGVDCASIGRILLNHSTECVGDGIEPSTCLRQLRTSTKTKIAFGV